MGNMTYFDMSEKGSEDLEREQAVLERVVHRGRRDEAGEARHRGPCKPRY